MTWGPDDDDDADDAPFDPVAAANAAVEARRLAALAAQQARIHADLEAQGFDVALGNTRGIPQPVVCTNVHGVDGRCLRFASTTDAAAFAGRTYRGDHVRRAIVRGGRCGRYAFRWVGGREPTERDRARELDRGRMRERRDG